MPKPRAFYEALETAIQPRMQNILTADDGDYWKAVRQGAAPCFSSTNMKKVWTYLSFSSVMLCLQPLRHADLWSLQMALHLYERPLSAHWMCVCCARCCWPGRMHRMCPNPKACYNWTVHQSTFSTVTVGLTAGAAVAVCVGRCCRWLLS